MANRLLKNALVAQAAVLEPVVRQSELLRNLVIGGDEWTDVNMNSYNNVVPSTPLATYMDTAVLVEERRSGDNTAEIYITRIEGLGPRKVLASVNDTGN